MVAPFDTAWSMLKALPEQQMFSQTMHPAIAAMVARRGIHRLDPNNYPPTQIAHPPGEGRRDDVDPKKPYLRVPGRGVSDLAQMERGSVFFGPEDISRLMEEGRI